MSEHLISSPILLPLALAVTIRVCALEDSKTDLKPDVLGQEWGPDLALGQISKKLQTLLPSAFSSRNRRSQKVYLSGQDFSFLTLPFLGIHHVYYLYLYFKKCAPIFTVFTL